MPRDMITTISDQFTSTSIELKSARHLCTPVDKAGEGIKNPANHLLCFRSKAVTRSAKGEFLTQNQFGSEQLRVVKHAELCVPAIAVP